MMQNPSILERQLHSTIPSSVASAAWQISSSDMLSKTPSDTRTSHLSAAEMLCQRSSGSAMRPYLRYGRSPKARETASSPCNRAGLPARSTLQAGQECSFDQLHLKWNLSDLGKDAVLIELVRNEVLSPCKIDLVRGAGLKGLVLGPVLIHLSQASSCDQAWSQMDFFLSGSRMHF